VELWTTDPRAFSREFPGAWGGSGGYPDIPSPYNEDYSYPLLVKDLKKPRTYVVILAENMRHYFPQSLKQPGISGKSR
jgi:hypothetical protein